MSTTLPGPFGWMWDLFSLVNGSEEAGYQARVECRECGRMRAHETFHWTNERLQGAWQIAARVEHVPGCMTALRVAAELAEAGRSP